MPKGHYRPTSELTTVCRKRRLQAINHSAQIVNSFENNLQSQNIINNELPHQKFLFPDNQLNISAQDENINYEIIDDHTPLINTNVLQSIKKEIDDNLTSENFKNKLVKLIIDGNFSLIKLTIFYVY